MLDDYLANMKYEGSAARKLHKARDILATVVNTAY